MLRIYCRFALNRNFCYELLTAHAKIFFAYNIPKKSYHSMEFFSLVPVELNVSVNVNNIFHVLQFAMKLTIIFTFDSRIEWNKE